MKVRFFKHRQLFANFKVKLFSLLSALFLWFYVVTDDEYEHILSVPLALQNKPEGWILTEPIPLEASVLFRGTGKDLMSFRHRDKRIDVDLLNATQTTTFPISVDMIKGIPASMSLMPLRIVQPETVSVRLDLFTEKIVPVRPDLAFIPMDGYTQVGDVILEPDSIIISGPKSFVDPISEVYTVGKEYRGLLKEIGGKVSLTPPTLETLVYSTDEIRFHADIQRIGERTLSGIVVRVTDVPQGMTVTIVPSTVSLKLQGGVNILSALKKEDVDATIDFRARYRYRGKRIPARIKVPPGITFSEAKPADFELVVER
ncbi:MAG: hypothetical protein ABIL68_11340 [bacterium]